MVGFSDSQRWRSARPLSGGPYHGGPTLQAALLCRSVEASGGIESVMDLIDSALVYPVSGVEWRSVAPFGLRAQLLLRFVAGADGAAHAVSVQCESPSGERVDAGRWDLEFTDAAYSVSSRALDIDMVVYEEGMYFLEVFLDGEFSALVPVDVAFARDDGRERARVCFSGSG